MRNQSELEQSLAAENARLKRQLAEWAEELAIVKKVATYFVDEHQGTFSVSAMSRVLQVSRSGFYAWRLR